MPTFYENEFNRYKDKPPTREYVIMRALEIMPDFIEKVVEGRSVEHPVGVLTALRDIMKEQKLKGAMQKE